MEINAGIVVVKQITDEKKWFQAMEHIRETFMWEDYFEMLPYFNKEDFNKVSMKKFNLDEDMNFSSNCFQTFDWHWREFPHKKDLSTLKIELSELKKKKEEFEKDERKYFGKYDQKDLENLTKAVEFKINCDEESKDLFQDISKHKIADRPPILFEFTVGEHPRLPIFGRHFKNCISKISGGSTAEPVLKTIFRILKEYFPTNIAYWCDMHEVQMEGFYKLDPKPWITKEIFYEDEKDVFSTLIVDDKGKFLEARQRMVSILTCVRNYYLAYKATYNQGTKTLEEFLAPDYNKITSTPVLDFFDPSTQFVDPKFTSLSRPSAKTSSAEQKAKTWVVEENKDKPWNMENVLEELGEVLTFLNEKKVIP